MNSIISRKMASIAHSSTKTSMNSIISRKMASMNSIISRKMASIAHSSTRAPSDVIGEAKYTPKVETLRTIYAKPQRAVGRKECQLNTFDLNYMGVEYIQRMLIFKNNGKFEDVEEKIKEGLCAVLEGFYPLAGKIGNDEEGILNVEYDDEMNGAEFKIAVVEETRVADMVKGRVTTFKEFIPYVGVRNFEGLYRSLLAVQLTKLKDGFVLGYAINHAVVDGISGWHFLKSWAERCKDPTYILSTPFHDRTKARNTRVKLNLPFKSNEDTHFPSTVEPIVQRLFSFSESTIDKIKSNANKSPTSPTSTKPFSTFQCVAAHVWRAITRARQLVPEDITMFAVFANLRNRLDPPMPETYFGTLIQPAFTATAAGVLYSSPPETSATLIQQAIETFDSETINARATQWEIMEPKQLKLTDVGRNIVAFGSSPYFKVYDLDFGWGNPEMVTRGYNNSFDGMVFLHQGKSGGRSIDVDISLEDKVMQRLEIDKEFLMEL